MYSSIRISPTGFLSGQVSVPAAKNSVLPLIAAALLCDGTVLLQEVPELSDTDIACKMVSATGGNACRLPSQHSGVARRTQLRIDGSGVRESHLPENYMGQMRSGIFFFAPVLLRTGRVTFHTPGGCKLGDRPVDIHLAGLEKMGAKVTQSVKKTLLSAPYGLTGCRFYLRYPSVGATETLLMAAVRAKGRTILENAALEPEVLDLVAFLNRCGGRISRLPGRRFAVEGVRTLSGCTFRPCPDRIWASTVLCAVAGCGGEVTVSDIPPRWLTGLPQLLQRSGCRVEYSESGVWLQSPGGDQLHGIGSVSTGPYPFFATDAAPILGAALLRANGYTFIRDRVFSSRFLCAKGFAELGAEVVVSENTLQIGLKHSKILKGTALFAPDLRGGAALVLAAMQAVQQSTLSNAELLYRGYAALPEILNALGADVTAMDSL